MVSANVLALRFFEARDPQDPVALVQAVCLLRIGRFRSRSTGKHPELLCLFATGVPLELQSGDDETNPHTTEFLEPFRGRSMRRVSLAAK